MLYSYHSYKPGPHYHYISFPGQTLTICAITALLVFPPHKAHSRIMEKFIQIHLSASKLLNGRVSSFTGGNPERPSSSA